MSIFLYWALIFISLGFEISIECRWALHVISPTHKRTEGRAPVWGSEFTTKAAALQGVQQKSLQRFKKNVFLIERVLACLRACVPSPSNVIARVTAAEELRPAT